jgi:hypothetical protein
MIGGPEEPQIASPDGQMASVSIPVPAPAVAHVGGARIPLARAPSVVKDLGPADHDLALRLINGRDPKLPWWSLELTGAELFYGGGRSEMVEPTGTLSPLLISAAGEVVAAVWTSSDGAVRHYVIPWMPAWMPVLEWLGQRGIPELVLSTAGRIESGVGEEAKVAGAAHSEPPTIDPADPTAESTPTPIAQPTTSEAAGAVAGDATQDDRAIRRPPLSRLRKKVRTLPHDVWSASKQHAPAIIVTAIGGTVATVVGTVVAFHITSGNGSHGPDVPESSSPAPSTTSTVPASATASMTTTASTSTSPPPLSALPLAPPEEQVIRAGSSGEFLGREVIVGVGLAYPSWSALTITTAKLSCTTTNLDVGQAVSVAGKNADRDDYFRITLLQSERDVSSTVRVEELPLPSWPTGALCPQ